MPCMYTCESACTCILMCACKCACVYQVAQMKNLNALPFVGAVSGGCSGQQTNQPANMR